MPSVCLCIFIGSHNPNIITSKHSTLVRKITVLFHEGIKSFALSLFLSVPTKLGLRMRLGEKPFGCLIMFYGLKIEKRDVFTLFC